MAILKHIEMGDFESFNGSPFKKSLEKYQKIIYVSNELYLTQRHVYICHLINIDLSQIHSFSFWVILLHIVLHCFIAKKKLKDIL